ncbi:MAG: glutamine-hydrolyzing carbamoyl-phosphate synthase small subunit, partial [Thermodesulfobacteriota bacterium]
SYNGQIVTMTYPEIGNYGVNPEDVESRRPFLKGFVVKEYWKEPSNWRSRRNLGSYLSEYGIVSIEGVDTRSLTKLIRSKGAQRAVISTEDTDPGSLLKKVRDSQGILGIDLVTEVSCENSYKWSEGTGVWRPAAEETPNEKKRFRVVAYDYGLKQNILRKLVDHGCEVHIVPSRTAPHEILSMDPDGVFLSNGPGDPAAVAYAVESVRTLIGKKPVFGICLGHQILGLALGGKTYKLKFGHRGANQPVKNLRTRKVEITSQNHGFAVDPDSLGSDIEVTHINLNDNTVEGLRHKEYPIFSVQYHPEASPGPHDSSYLFKEFIKLMDEDS